MKTCRSCHETKPLEAFAPRGEGLRAQCRSCEKVRADRWRDANRSHLLNAKRRHYRENAEAYKARVLAYQRANPEMKAAINQRRRAAGKVTAADIRFLFDAQKGHCPVCRTSLRDGYQVDHVVAIANGGTSDKENLQLLCFPCNRRKSNKDPIAFMQQEGFLL